MRSACCTGCGIAMVATGCLAIPAYKPEVSVSYSPAAADSGAAVIGPGFKLQFAGGDAFHFPDALFIDGTNVLGRDPAPGCFDEDEAGVLIAPTPRISAHGSAMRVTNRLTPTLLGPAVVQVTEEWGTRFSCSTLRTPGGTSTFTAFPDGRIVRHDVVTDSSSADVSAYDCACDKNATGASSFTVSTFWALTQAGFSDLYTNARTDVRMPLPARDETASTNHDTACLGNGAVQIALAWPQNAGTTILGGDTLIAFGRDLLVRNSLLNDYPWDDSTGLFIEHRGCDAAFRRATEHVTPPELVLGGDTPIHVSPSAHDGIYGGRDSDGQSGITLQSARAELTGSTTSPFAVWLRFPGAIEAVRATLEGKTGAWYLPQQVNDREWIIWFRDPLSITQKIAVEPR